MSAEVKPGYKLTEVGVIPEDWEIHAIGKLASFKSGNSISVSALQQQSSDSPIPVYGGNGIAGYTTTHLVLEPVIVVGRVGQKCGQVYLTKGPAWITDNALYPRVIYREIDVRFFSLTLKAAGLNEVKNRNDLPLVTQSILHSVRIALPPTKAEQEAIAEALSDADALIESLEQLITKKRQIKQGAMQDLLTGKKRLPGFRGEWEVKRLGDVVKISKGQLITEKNASSGDIPVIAGGKKPAYFHNKPNRIGKTITVSASGASAGYVAIFDEPIFASDCSTISEGEGYSIDFIYSQLQLKQEIIYQAQTGGAQPHIHAVDLMPIEIGVPSFSEQQAIAIILFDMDAEIGALGVKIENARQLKQGMMHKLLTGKIRLV